MKDKDTKKRVELYSIWDHTGLEDHLARMAERGWLVEKIGNLFWSYRRVAPKRRAFCVTYCPKASDFAPGPTEEQETFYAFCRHAGWELAASCAQLQVFVNEGEDPVPIETDPVLELDTIHKTVKRGVLPVQGLLAVTALLNGALLAAQLARDPIQVLSSASSFVSAICWMLVLLLTGSEVIAYYRWRARAKQAAERGEFLATNSRIKLQITSLAITAGVLLYYFLSIFTSGDPVMMAVAPLMFLGLGLLIFLANALKRFLKRKKVSAGVNRAATLAACFILSLALMGGVTFGMLVGMQKGWFAGKQGTYQVHGSVFTVYADPLPLSVEDLTGGAYGGDAYTREWRDDASLALARYEARQHPRFDGEDYMDLPRLEYTVTLVKFPALYSLCKRSLLAEYDGSEEYWEDRKYALQDPAPWGAEEAYRVMDQYGAWDIYLLCYPDRFVELRPSWELTAEQAALVGERLGCRYG